MSTQQELITSVVSEVLARLGDGSSQATAGPSSSGSTSQPSAGASSPRSGLHADVNAAVDAAERAQKQLAEGGLALRDAIVKRIKRMAVDHADAWGRFELDETKIGRLDHKIAKLQLLENVPGVEFLRTAAHSGDAGVSLDEAAPWGVIGVITPVTHSVPTLMANAINMIASGNALIANPHPSAAKSAAMAAKACNEAIAEEFGLGPLVNVIDPPTLRTAEQIFGHERIPMLVATGGPAVARAAMKQPKRSVVAGPGNPPVVVDETADLDLAARSILQGAAFDNNLLCIGEKEVFVVASVFDGLVAAFHRAGAMMLDAGAVDRLTEAAFDWKNDHYVVSKDLIGRDPQVLGEAAGVRVPARVELLIGETSADNPFVPEEQMMPFVPLVRVPDFERALELSIEHEHGFGHTAVIHSNRLDRITRMGRVMNTTLFIANGPSTAGLGVGGEGYPSYSIATPSGEGVTSPLTFTRFRRNSIAGSLRIV